MRSEDKEARKSVRMAYHFHLWRSPQHQREFNAYQDESALTCRNYRHPKCCDQLALANRNHRQTDRCLDLVRLWNSFEIPYGTAESTKVDASASPPGAPAAQEQPLSMLVAK